MPDGAIIAAIMPIYGTKDACINFRLRLEYGVKKQGFKLNYILPTFFALRNEKGSVIAVLPTNVDDFLHGFFPVLHSVERILFVAPP